MHIIHLYQDMNIVHLLYIRVFQHLYFIIIFNLVLLFLMSIKTATVSHMVSDDTPTLQWLIQNSP